MPIPIAPLIGLGSSLLSSLVGGITAKVEQNDPLRKLGNRNLNKASKLAGAIPQASQNAANLASSARNQALIDAMDRTAASKGGLNTSQAITQNEPILRQNAIGDAAGQAQQAAASRAQAANALSGIAQTASSVEAQRAQSDTQGAGQFGGFAEALTGGLTDFLAPNANMPKGSEILSPVLGIADAAKGLSGDMRAEIERSRDVTEQAISGAEAGIGDMQQYAADLQGSAIADSRSTHPEGPQGSGAVPVPQAQQAANLVSQASGAAQPQAQAQPDDQATQLARLLTVRNKESDANNLRIIDEQIRQLTGAR